MAFRQHFGGKISAALERLLKFVRFANQNVQRKSMIDSRGYLGCHTNRPFLAIHYNQQINIAILTGLPIRVGAKEDDFFWLELVYYLPND